MTGPGETATGDDDPPLQGSEYPAVVIPLTTSAWMMVPRNLLYTAITRAKQLVVLVGSCRALAAATPPSAIASAYRAGKQDTVVASPESHPESVDGLR